MKVCIVVGTRPEIIKMSPLIKECQKRKIDFDIINARQHFSDNMCDVFFRELELPTPAFLFQVQAGGHAQQISSLLVGFDTIFSKSSYDIVLVQGDTNAVFAAALIASRYQIPIGHIEAGLRSKDRTMPEEINRILVDHLSTYLFAASSQSQDNLKGEGIRADCIWNTGNTVVDATLRAIKLAKKKSFKKDVVNKYILLTLHRPGNVDATENLEEIIKGIQQVSNNHRLSVIFPIHPRTKAKILASKLTLPSQFHLLDPVGYLDFLRLLSNARLIMTDSGGIQEEACILQVPCVTLRKNTERPETITVGANLIGGVTKETIWRASNTMLKKRCQWGIPYGDGHSAEKILSIIKDAIDKE